MFIPPVEMVQYVDCAETTISPLISKELQNRIQTCLPVLLHSGQMYSVSPIKRGHNDMRNFIVEVEGKKYVLKLLPLEIEEQKALKVLYMIEESSRLQIGPKVVASSISERAVLMEYIDGPTITPAMAREHAREIGVSMRIMHTSSQNPHTGSAKHFDDSERRYRFIQERSNFPGAKEAIEFIRENAPKLSSDCANVHGDLHPHNLFWTEDGFKILDWEFVVWDNPYIDIGRISTSLAFDETADTLFLEGYFNGTPTEQQKEQFLLSKKLNYACQVLMCFKITDLILAQEQEPLDLTAEPQEWSHYMDSFSVATERMPLQFFYDAARCASKKLSSDL